MPTVLQRIIDIAAAPNSSATDALRQARILAVRLGYEPFRKWVTLELDGYKTDDPLPRDRVILTQPLGHFLGMFGREAKNAPIPPMNLPEDLREYITRIKLYEGIATYETMAKAAHAHGTATLRYPFPYDILPLYGDRIYEGMNCVDAWLPLPVTALDSLVETTKNKLLGFALDLEIEAPEAGESIAQSAIVATDVVQHVFHNHFHGTTTNVAIGSQQVTQTATLVQAGNLESLAQHLSRHGVSDDDITALVEAIGADPRPTEPGTMGPNVTSWFEKMMGKAASGAWGVGVGAAANLLADGIAAFYGTVL